MCPPRTELIREPGVRSQRRKGAAVRCARLWWHCLILSPTVAPQCCSSGLAGGDAFVLPTRLSYSTRRLSDSFLLQRGMQSVHRVDLGGHGPCHHAVTQASLCSLDSWSVMVSRSAFCKIPSGRWVELMWRCIAHSGWIQPNLGRARSDLRCSRPQLAWRQLNFSWARPNYGRSRPQLG